MYQDKTLTCRECGADFIFSASEQEFYEEKGFTNKPGRCPQCRAARKQKNNNGFGRGMRTQREMFSAICASCGTETQVPFRPREERPVYCRECYAKNSNRY